MDNCSKIFTKKGLAGWWEYYASLGWDIIGGFVEEVEVVANESIHRFESEKKIKLYEDPEFGQREVVVHRRIDSDMCPLDDLFRIHFPNLHRRSALLTVWSSFEKELDDLCNEYQKRRSLKIELSDMNGKGIDRSVAYLEKVVGFNVQRDSAEWHEIKIIQRMRNLFVHQNGYFSDTSNKNKELLRYISTNTNLKVEYNEIIILSGYLQKVLAIMRKYFELLVDANSESD